MAKLPVDENHQVQLAMSVPIHKMPLPAIGELKYNGCRITTLYHGPERIEFKTRNSHLVQFPAMAEYVKFLEPGFMYDGEWCKGDSKGTNHTAVSGMVNSSIKTGTAIPATVGWQYHMFDCMPIEQFQRQKCPMNLHKRVSLLHGIYKNAYGRCEDWVHLARQWRFEDHAEIERVFNELLEQGYEGMIIKALDSMYTFKKNKTWMKLKNEDTADLKCVGWVEGKGKYVGMIGKLLCEGYVNGKFVRVGVGTGLTDEDRAKDPEEYLQKIIEVKYNEVCRDVSTGEWSLFLPVFIIVREDKS